MCVHGDKKQEERDWVIGEFRSGSSPILLATDVAARGLGKSSHIVLKTTAKMSKMLFQNLKYKTQFFHTKINNTKSRGKVKLPATNKETLVNLN